MRTFDGVNEVELSHCLKFSGRGPRWGCNNQVFVSNFCCLITLLLLFPACVIYSPFVVLSTFVVLSNFCHFLTPCYLFTFYVIYALYKCTFCTHHKHNSLSPVSSCARSLRQYIFLTHQASLTIVPV